jgi:succinate dehydrogenase / fumarate reductase, cytochrome b subunit
MTNYRPLSPHLSIHKKLLTSIFSIFHRISGIGLSIGSILLAIWISLLSLGPDYFFIFQLISKTIVFKVILIFWSIGLFYHLFNGIRYLYWTYGLGMELKNIYVSGYLVIFFTFSSSFLMWFFLI